jgi:hypothetical protein
MIRGVEREASFRLAQILRPRGALVLALGPAFAAILLSAGAPAPAAGGERPDGRVYEQVSTAEKHGLGAFSPYQPEPVQVSAQEGSAEGSLLAYQNFGTFGSPSSNTTANLYLGKRNTSGWQTSELTPPTLGPLPPGIADLGYDFSADLSRVVIKLPWLALAPETPPGAFGRLYNLFLRAPDGGYSRLTTAPPKVPVPESCLRCWLERDISAFAGASSDYAHVIFEANESLTPGAPGEGVASLYESREASAGQPREVLLVGILPDGTIPAEGSMPGAGLSVFYGGGVARAASSNIDHAISTDGSHVIFQALADGGTSAEAGQAGKAELYDRANGSKTVEISAPAEGAEAANPAAEEARFWAASPDGALVFFTSSAELTTESNTGEGNVSEDLYRFNTATNALTDLTIAREPVDASTGAGVQGVVGVSEVEREPGEGPYVYFVATGRLANGATDGQPNLYVSHGGGAPRFIATLSGEDSADWTSTPTASTAYLTPDGRHLAFMSVGRPTDYDNRDRNTGQPDSEVYEYDGEGSATLVCASCDPSGAQPVSSAFTGAAPTSGRLGTPFHQPRVISNDGRRLFFSSSEPPPSGVGVGYAKVFEYEGGAVYPISSSASSAADVFLDASPSGNDVFFATYDRLTSGDQDNLMDIYDARVGGGFPPVPAPPTPCAAGACQAHGAPPSLPTLASTLSIGAGNLPAPATRPISHKSKKRKAKTKRRRPKRHRAKKSKGRRARHAAVRVNRQRSR